MAVIQDQLNILSAKFDSINTQQWPFDHSSQKRGEFLKSRSWGGVPFWRGVTKNNVYLVYCLVLFYVYVYGVGYGIMFLNNVFIMGLIQCVKQFGYSAIFKTHGYVWVWNFGLLILKMLFSLVCTLNLYPCCFCKLLGLISCICRLLWFVPMLCCIVLVVLSCITSSTLTLMP